MALNQTAFLCLLWVATILYGEMFSFWLPSLFNCSWPSPPPKVDGVESSGDYVKIAVLADPQLMDKTSHGLPPKSLLLEISQFYSDIFMRRAFLASVMPLKPDIVLFLGDYFDGGPVLSDEEWQESLNRLKHIFDLEKLKGSTNHQVYFISGNHDIGYVDFYSHRPEVIRRYESEFGARNYRFTAGKVDFVVIDSQTLDGKEGNQASETWNFIKNISTDSTSLPRVLLTHIPLYRPDWTSCGPHRFSQLINQRINRADDIDKGILYQNYVTEEATNKLLDQIRPILVLSGHDHDQCTVTHTCKQGPVNEHTLGTVSWQQGNLFPSFMLLSVSNHTFQNASDVRDAVSTQLCFLPAQTFIYIWYLSQFLLTILAVHLWPTNGLGIFRQIGDLTRNIISFYKVGTKEKDEDENCEYEMVWDAEGSMHLIKKASSTSLTGQFDKVVIEKGSAVMRSTAKKQISQDIEVSLPVDMNSLPIKTKKSRAINLARLVRTLRTLTVVAAVNLPIYMMLLFKDWVDK